jgi:hypothetical protein
MLLNIYVSTYSGDVNVVLNDKTGGSFSFLAPFLGPKYDLYKT